MAQVYRTPADDTNRRRRVRPSGTSGRTVRDCDRYIRARRLSRHSTVRSSVECRPPIRTGQYPNEHSWVDRPVAGIVVIGVGKLPVGEYILHILQVEEVSDVALEAESLFTQLLTLAVERVSN